MAESESPGFGELVKTAWEDVKSPFDKNELFDIVKDNKDAALSPLKKLKEDGATDHETPGILGGLGKVVDTYTTGKGAYNIEEGFRNGNADEGFDGLHDLLSGGSGLLGNSKAKWARSQNRSTWA